MNSFRTGEVENNNVKVQIKWSLIKVFGRNLIVMLGNFGKININRTF